MKRNPQDLQYKVVSKLKDSRAKAEIHGRTILSKPYTRKADIVHEEGHYVLGHNLHKLPKTPQSYVREELDANLYAYKKTKHPQHIKGNLRALANDVYHYEYRETPKATIKIMDNAMSRKGMPTAWKNDWRGVKKEAKKAFGDRL